jgi:hypothetical protein
MRSFNYIYRSWTAFLLILFSVTISANGPVHAKEQTNQASSEKAPPNLIITDYLQNIVRVDAGYDHTCALTTGGGVKCRDRNLDGQLGGQWWSEEQSRHAPDRR